MKYRSNRWMIALFATAALPLATSSPASAGGKSIGKDSGVHPSHVEQIAGSELSRVTLTARAMQRIDLQTELVREEMIAGSPRKVVPYSSIIYDPNGGTWVYTSPKPATFIRERVDVDFIEGNQVVLKQGPAVGTVVASVGVAELYGTEFAVGH